jgi:hypothetical protein
VHPVSGLFLVEGLIVPSQTRSAVAVVVPEGVDTLQRRVDQIGEPQVDTTAGGGPVNDLVKLRADHSGGGLFQFARAAGPHQRVGAVPSQLSCSASARMIPLGPRR